MWILTLISVLVTVAYIGYVIKKTDKLPVSVSACVYEFSEKTSLMCWTGFMWVAGICGMIPLVAKLDKFGMIGFVTIALIAFIGVMPLSEKETRPWHYWLSVMIGVLSQVCVALVCPYWLLIWTIWLPFLAGAIAAMNDSEETPTLLNDKAILFAEMTCAISVWGCCVF